MPSAARSALMRFGAIANPKDFGWYREWATTADQAGFSLLATGDSQSLWADPFMTLAVGATVTHTPRLAVTVANPRTRHPAVVAGALATLNQVSGGRAVLGLGSGDSALRNIGLRAARVAEVATFANAVRQLCAGQDVVWDGGAASLRWAAFELPIWIAAEGPRTQYLAGQIADGVLLSNALDVAALARAKEHIAAGAQTAGRSLDDIEVWCMAAMCFADTEATGIHRLRSLLAGTANHVYRFGMDDKEVPKELRAAITILQQRYDSRHHASPETAEHNAELVEDLGLTDFLAARSVIAGPPERCVERINELASHGIANVLIHHQANDPLEFMDLFKSAVTPALGLLDTHTGLS